MIPGDMIPSLPEAKTLRICFSLDNFIRSLATVSFWIEGRNCFGLLRCSINNFDALVSEFNPDSG